jgi:hypothetical protein
MSMKRIAVALALVIGLAAVSACGTDQASQQTGGSNTSNEATPPFAPEVAERPAADYSPNIYPSNFVKGIDNLTFRSSLARRGSTRARPPRAPSA